jgi:hypothetical protein
VLLLLGPRLAHPEHRRFSLSHPKDRAMDCAVARRYRDVPSGDAVAKSDGAEECWRQSGCVLFGYFLLHKQEKVTRPRGETRN